MAITTTHRIGMRVEVPQHRTTRGQARRYDEGQIVDISKRGLITVQLDDGRVVYARIGLVTAKDE